MLDTNGLELGLNGVLSGHDLLKIGPSTRIVSDTFSKMNKLIGSLVFRWYFKKYVAIL